MTSKEEIRSWFIDAVSSQRIDLMCGLLHLCLPLELRFVGSCLEDLARKDYGSLREYELKSNDSAGYTTLMASSSSSDDLQNTLNIYISLLNSSNRVCANNLFHILEGLHNRLQLSEPQRLNDDSKIFKGEKVAEDLLLLFTMAAHHPAFTFSQRLKLYESLKSVQQFLEEFSDKENCPKFVETSTSPINQRLLNVACQTPLYDGHFNSNKIHVELKRNHRNRSSDCLIQVTLSDGSLVETYRSHKDLKNFHEQVEKYLNHRDLQDEGFAGRLLFPSEKMFGASNEKQLKEDLNGYFRDMFFLPENVLQDLEFRHLFGDLMRLSEPIDPPPSPTPLSPAASKTPSYFSSSSKLPASQISKSNTKATTYSRSSCRLPVTPVSTSDLTMAVVQSRSNHMLEGSIVSTPSVSPSPLSSRSSPSLPNQGTRSRHNSAQNSIPSWLKDIRLHKYTDKLSRYSWKELFCVSEADLQREGLTSGACKKFINEIYSIRLKYENSPECFIETVSGRARNLSSASSPMNYATSAPQVAAALIAKSIPVSSPGSIDSSCSEYSTPPGSPELKHLPSNKTRNRNVFGQHTVGDRSRGATVKDKDQHFSSSSILIKPDLAAATAAAGRGGGTGGDDSEGSCIVRSISLESSLSQKSTSSDCRRPPRPPHPHDLDHHLYHHHPDHPHDHNIHPDVVDCISNSDLLSATPPVHHQPIPLAHPSAGLIEISQTAVDFPKVPPGVAFQPSWSAVGHPWSSSSPRCILVRPLMAQMPGVNEDLSSDPRSSIDPRSFHFENVATRHKFSGSDATLTEYTGWPDDVASSSPGGFNMRMNAPTSPALNPQPMPLPSDAVLVRPRLSVPGVSPLARISAMVPAQQCFPEVAASTAPPLYPSLPPSLINQAMNKPNSISGALCNDAPDMTNPPATALFPFSLEQPSQQQQQPTTDGILPPSFVPGFFTAMPMAGANSMPVMHAMPYAVTIASSTIASQNATPFQSNNDETIDDSSVCHHCGQYRWHPASFVYQNVWPMEHGAYPPTSPCYSVSTNSLISQPRGPPVFRPLTGPPQTQVPFRLPNGLSPELHYQACNYSITMSGVRQMHLTGPAAVTMVRPSHQIIRSRGIKGGGAVSTCSNCGSSGHSNLECKEQTIDSVLGTGQFHLSVVPKSEVG